MTPDQLIAHTNLLMDLLVEPGQHPSTSASAAASAAMLQFPPQTWPASQSTWAGSRACGGPLTI